MNLNYKLSEFNIECSSLFPGWTLLFNSRTGAFLTLSEEDMSHWSHLQGKLARGEDIYTDRETSSATKLASSGFIVPKDFDERRSVREEYARRTSHDTGDLALTIAPTVSCNLRCGYCFQDHPKRSFSDVDIERVYTFVADRLGRGRHLSVTWFGGEPLVAMSAIQALGNRFKKLATERKANFSQSIITNGVLLTTERVNAILEIGRPSMVQITLDGPREIHNSRRFTSTRKGTFDTILENIVQSCELLPIVVRVNVDRRNLEGLEELVLLLEERQLKQRIGLYLGHVEVYTDQSSSATPHVLSTAEFSEIENQFSLYLLRRGWGRRFQLPKPRVGSLCTADNPNGFVIAPDGAVFQCWNEVALPIESAKAQLTRDGALQSRSKVTWLPQDFNPFHHIPCQTCEVMPLCRGGCPWESLKHPENEPGHCTTNRFGLRDLLRYYHLQETIKGNIRNAFEAGDLEKKLSESDCG